MKKCLCITISFLLILSFLLAGCGGGGGGSSSSSGPEDVVNAFWSAVQDGDFETASTYFTGEAKDEFMPTGGDLVQAEAMSEVMFSRFSMDPKSHEIDGDTSTVLVDVTSPDMGEVMVVLMGMAFEMMTPEMQEKSDEELEEIMLEKLVEAMDEAPLSTYEIPVYLERVDGEWKITEEINLMEFE